MQELIDKNFKKVLYVNDKTGRVNRKLTCNICSRPFMKRCNARDHIMAHKGIKPFQCKVCGA